MSERLRSTWVSPKALPPETTEKVLGTEMERSYTLMELLKRPRVHYADLMTIPGAGQAVLDATVSSQVEIQAKYEGYIRRQQEEVERAGDQESLPLPTDLDYREVRGLSIEAQQKLTQHRPGTVGEASRISGVTPAAISLLLVHLKRRRIQRAAA